MIKNNGELKQTIPRPEQMNEIINSYNTGFYISIVKKNKEE